MKVVRWINTNFWSLASWAFLIVAMFNMGTEDGTLLALLGLGALAVHEILTALRSPAAVTFAASPFASANIRTGDRGRI